MQAKGIVKFFLVLLLLMCAGQILYYIPTGRVEKDAANYAKQQAALATESDRVAAEKVAYATYLDSMSSVKMPLIPGLPWLGSYTYQELKSKQLALGLDLKGGMSVLLQVDLNDFVTALSSNSTDPSFQTALKNAQAIQKQSQGDFIAIFVSEFQKVAGQNKLAGIFARNESLKNDITMDASDSRVQDVMRKKANETVEETYKRLKQRIDKLGVVQPNVSLDKSRDIIVVELPGIENPERARNFLKSAAKLEFWEVYRLDDAGIADALVDADKTLKVALGDTSKVAANDTASQFQTGPLFTNLQPNQQFNVNPQSPSNVIGYAEKNKRKLVSEYLARPEIAQKFPRDLVFSWSKDAIKDAKGNSTNVYELHALRKTPGKDGPALEGERVADARATTGDKGSNGYEISLTMDNTGASLWADLTKRCADDKRRPVAIVLDDEVVSAPHVINPIEGGRSSITGNYNAQEAQDMASMLQVGKLPAKAEIIQESTIGPSLGADNISKSLTSMGLAFAAILVFMTIYYSTGGFIAVVALFANLFFIIGALTSYGTVLTLPGIAGIVLTMGMAVDANVIIYERIREELAAGKSVAVAAADGFKHAFSAILDGNVTALIAAASLAIFGLGPIKGFGVVLIIGTIFTVFTAYLLSRLIVDWALAKGWNIKFFAPFSENAFKNINFDWMKLRKRAYVVSALIIGAGAVAFFTRGFELGVDFKGGYSFNVAFDKKVTADDLRNTLTPIFDNQSTIVKAVSTENTFNITTSYRVNEVSAEAQNEVIAKLHEGVKKITGQDVSIENFKRSDYQGTHIISSTKVGPTVADDIKSSSSKAAFFGLIFIGLYIFIQFNRWQFSVGAVVATTHDALITLSVFAIFHGILPFSLEIDQALVAAILTILGYSINDTVIVYDRIREYVRLYNKKPMPEIINSAINSTFSRTMITSLTIVMVLLILFLFGGSSIKGFAFALLIGIIAGTYSSVFIAAPIMLDFSKNLDLTDANTQTTEGGKKSLKEKA